LWLGEASSTETLYGENEENNNDGGGS